MKKITIITFLLLSFAAAQAQSPHEFSIYGGGGLSTLKYDVNVTGGEQKMGFGGHFGLGYQYFFSSNWGLGIGVEIGLYNSKFEMKKGSSVLDITQTAIDPMTSDPHHPNAQTYEFDSHVTPKEEKQCPMFLQIPLMLQFQSNGNHKFFARAGGKVGIPMSKKYEGTAILQIDDERFYAYESYTYNNFRGDGKAITTKDDLSLKPAFMLSAEAGMKWRLSDNWSLYTGAYLDYGLNDIQDKAAPQLVTYNNNGKFTVHSVVNSRYSVNQMFTDKVTPLAVGIKLRLAFANERVSKQRAENAKAYLISNGIATNRITGTASKRDTEPLVPNTNEENRKQNRRVVMIVQ